jgi:hypothetical protein
MSQGHLCFILAIAACRCAAQETISPEEDVWHAASDYIQAIQQADGAKIALLQIREARLFSPGGISASAEAIKRFALSWKTRSYLIRHVQLLDSGAALAIGVWRDPSARPPYDAGTFDFTFVREQGRWKIASVHGAFLAAPGGVSLDGASQSTTNRNAGRAPRTSTDWEPLFDGRTSNGWQTIGGNKDVSSSWRIEDGCLITVPEGPRSDLRTDREFLYFELEFDWKTAAKANSGVKYRLYGADMFTSDVPRQAVGFEYQIADDTGDPGARSDPRQRSGALYGVTAVSRSLAKPLGEWNQSRILVTQDHVEHWLNGVLSARYPVDVPFPSPISLQHHVSDVRFRNIRIRPLNNGSR